MVQKILLRFLLLALIFAGAPNIYGQEAEEDSITTPFRKGRWLIGLSGSISSGATENTSIDRKTNSNRYRIEVGAGNFIANRINIGFLTHMERENAEDDASQRTSEIFFIGPKGAYYFSKSEIGSLFFSTAPGFMLYRENTGLLQDEVFTESLYKGFGFGVLSTLGYSYVIHDRVSLDLGLNLSLYWVDVDQDLTPVGTNEEVNFEISNLSFSFGFKVLLDSLQF